MCTPVQAHVPVDGLERVAGSTSLAQRSSFVKNRTVHRPSNLDPHTGKSDAGSAIMAPRQWAHRLSGLFRRA